MKTFAFIITYLKIQSQGRDVHVWVHLASKSHFFENFWRIFAFVGSKKHKIYIHFPRSTPKQDFW